MALGVVWKTIAADGKTPYVSFICFFITAPLIFEIWRTYDARRASWSLKIFFELFVGVLLFGIGELFLDFPDHFVSIVITLIVFVLLVVLLPQIGKLNSFAGAKPIPSEEELVRTIQSESTWSEEEKEKLLKDARLTGKSLRYSERALRGFLYVLLILVAFLVVTVGGRFLYAWVDAYVKTSQPIEIAAPN
jgi:hypothetical protein